MRLVISIDVEEEGLFSGQYLRTPPGVTNVAELRRLEFIPREFGLPLTLLVSYQVARDPAAQKILAHLQDRYQAEIGLHLHPWNTPPFAPLPDPEPVPSERLPLDLLRAKLANLKVQVESACRVAPRSFRMGRFDVGPKILSLLPEMGVLVDSSVVPLTRKGGGHNNFLAPADPFAFNPSHSNLYNLLEVPVTMVPVWARAPILIRRLDARLPQAWGKSLEGWFRYVGAAGVQPAWYSLASMQLAARLHRRRGGQVLTMFFHSSELKPGATRLFPTEAAVNQFVGKIRGFLAWLVSTGPVTGMTLAGLYEAWHRIGQMEGGTMPESVPHCRHKQA